MANSFKRSSAFMLLSSARMDQIGKECHTRAYLQCCATLNSACYMMSENVFRVCHVSILHHVHHRSNPHPFPSLPFSTSVRQLRYLAYCHHNQAQAQHVQ